ncbi:MAG TPA: FkbM family methyltransferase [Ruminiclostridium sp.]|nr:FkbM family methyltransferase [Ruminiclostridium sp.]
MKLASLAKPFLSLYVSLIKSNRYLQKYVFSVPLKKEVTDYIENVYFQGYLHIEKSIDLAQKMNLKDMDILDVGGAIGNTARLYAKSFPRSRVWVFEPMKETYQKLQAATSSFPNITLVNKAVGSTVGRTVINRANRITSSSILNIRSESNSAVFSDTLIKKGEEEIEITTLDSTVPKDTKISILKIDVQGYELEVLKGAKETLTRTSIITLELNNHENYQNAPKYYEIDEYLRSSNFTVYDIFPSLKDKGRLKEWDAIYVRNELIQ